MVLSRLPAHPQCSVRISSLESGFVVEPHRFASYSNPALAASQHPALRQETTKDYLSNGPKVKSPLFGPIRNCRVVIRGVDVTECAARARVVVPSLIRPCKYFCMRNSTAIALVVFAGARPF